MSARGEGDSQDQPGFDPGESILYRTLDERQQVTSVLPVRVVQDTDDLIAMWIPLGTPTIKPQLIHHTPGTPRRWVEGNWNLIPAKWRWAELLILVCPGQARAVWVRWSAVREFEGWAVNLQSPLTRTRLGFDHWDQQLDILVAPDRRWQWKDEDELELAVELGRMSRAQAEEVRAEGLRAVEEIEQCRFPYGNEWACWRPDPTWAPPELVDRWDDLSMYHQAEGDR